MTAYFRQNLFPAISLCLGAFWSGTVHATSFVVVDSETGYILNAADANRKAPIASLTKVATAMVTLDWLELSKNDASQIATIPPQAVAVGGANPVGLRAGDRMSLRDLLYCALLQSDNVAATAVADHVGRRLLEAGAVGSNPLDAFVFQMNQLAIKLNMRRTKFVNPSGLDGQGRAGHSTASDMARLTRYAIKDSAFRFYVSQSQRSVRILRTGGESGYVLKNTNELLGRMGVDGVKTGRTSLAGDCLILSAAREPESKQIGDRFIITPRRLIVVLLNSRDRFREGASLMSQGWQAYEAWAAQGRQFEQQQAL